jgi:sugar phosphate isomerase/epimerase
MTTTRRQALQLAAGATLAPLSGLAPAAAAPAAPAPKRVRLAVSSYSYWHFRTERYPIEKVIEHAASLGFDGVEILHRGMAEEGAAYVNNLKRLALRNAIDLVMLSIHQDFVHPEANERQTHVGHTKHCISLAARLGIPIIRINSGRWNTIASFDDLMKVKGDEPPISGHTDDEAVKWCVDAIEQCLPDAEREGVMLALENHWGLTTRPEMLLKIAGQIRSPWFGINLDTGNFPGDPYPGIEMLAPHAVIVQAKTYYGGGEWYTLDLDYPRIARTLRQAGFQGWVSLEMEGKEPAATAVPKSLEVLRAAFAV